MGRPFVEIHEFPEYKAKRKVDPKLVALKDEWKKQRVLIGRMLRHMGVDQLIAENMEADDLAGRIVAARDEPTILVSGDKDWLQLVNENVSWIDPTHDRQCRLGNFKEISGFESPGSSSRRRRWPATRETACRLWVALARPGRSGFSSKCELGR